MNNDYRRTRYEESAGDLINRKTEVEQNIRADHPKLKDLHTLLHENLSPYKMAFIKAYGGKCAYCGVSIRIIDKKQFEIDHYIPHTDRARFKTKGEAGCMENLVLACYDCNRNKGDYSVPDHYRSELHPDGQGIMHCFYRDEDYYIRLNPAKMADSDIVNFYNQLRLSQEIHRLDYLLMSLKGLRDKHSGNNEICSILSNAIMLMQEKRNNGIS